MEILELLGEGAYMGAVHKAHDRELERDVALKLIAPGLPGNPKHSLVSSRNCSWRARSPTAMKERVPVG
jgi:serine/threonine protein kinase